MSTCRVISCVAGRGCLLWPVHSVSKTLLAFTLLHFVLQGQICLLLQVFLDFLILHSSPLSWKGHLFGVLVLEGLIDLHRTVQLQFLQHYWSGHRLGLLWYWMVCLVNEQRSFCCFWDCIEVLHFSGEGNGTPLQYSCLENPREGGAWWAAVYWVAQSRTRLKRLSSKANKNGR